MPYIVGNPRQARTVHRTVRARGRRIASRSARATGGLRVENACRGAARLACVGRRCRRMRLRCDRRFVADLPRQAWMHAAQPHGRESLQQPEQECDQGASRQQNLDRNVRADGAHSRQQLVQSSIAHGGSPESRSMSPTRSRATLSGVRLGRVSCEFRFAAGLYRGEASQFAHRGEPGAERQVDSVRGALGIVAVIEEPAAITRIVTHLGMPGPRRGAASGAYPAPCLRGLVSRGAECWTTAHDCRVGRNPVK